MKIFLRPDRRVFLFFWLALVTMSAGCSTMSTAPEKQVEAVQLTPEQKEIVDATCKKATGYAEDNEYRKAFQAIDKALRKLPASPRLSVLRENLRKDYDKELVTYKDRLELNTARARHKELTLMQEKTRLQSPSLFTNLIISRLEGKLASDHARLLECGKRQMDYKNFDLAGACLQTAEKIKSSEEVDKTIRKLRMARTAFKLPPKKPEGEPLPVLKADNSKISRTPPDVAKPEKTGDEQELSENQIARLRKDFQLALAKNELVKASDMLDKLTEMNLDEELLGALHEQLENSRRQYIEELLTKGTQLYRMGAIQEARDTWYIVLKIDPGNPEAALHIKRAEKVLNSLEKLKNNDQ